MRAPPARCSSKEGGPSTTRCGPGVLRLPAPTACRVLRPQILCQRPARGDDAADCPPGNSPEFERELTAPEASEGVEPKGVSSAQTGLDGGSERVLCGSEEGGLETATDAAWISATSSEKRLKGSCRAVGRSLARAHNTISASPGTYTLIKGSNGYSIRLSIRIQDCLNSNGYSGLPFEGFCQHSASHAAC